MARGALRELVAEDPHDEDCAVSNGTVVLMYHRVGEARNAWERKYCVAPERFVRHMAALASHGLQAVPLGDLFAALAGPQALPANSVVVTFDDGFRSVREHALPVLERMRWPFSVFLVSDLLGQEDVWTRAENPDGVTYPLLCADEILDMQRRGVVFGSHSRTHASLPTLDDAELAGQLDGSRANLSALLGRDVAYLAYPFGHLDDRVEAAARAAGYRGALSTQPGFNRIGVNPFRIRRIDVYGTDTPATLMRKVRLGSNDGALTHAAGYYLDRMRVRLSGGNA
jgi:peptidoglycan/xylan/chitin deacetylase (PgdA/CDA1 family)